MASSLSDLDGIYYDTEDDQNEIVIFNGDFQIGFDYLSEVSTIAPTGTPDEYAITIIEGDRIGAPTYRIRIVKQKGAIFQFQRDGKPFLNKSGLYERNDDPEELSAYVTPEDEEIELTASQRANAWMDEDSVKEIVRELNRKQPSAVYLDFMITIRDFGACDFSAALPHLQKLAKHKDPEVAEAAKKTIQVIG